MSEGVSSPETAEAVLGFIRTNLRASVREIAAAVGIGRTTAHRAINRLIQDGAIRVTRSGTGDQYPNTYEVLSVTGEPAADRDRAARIDELGRAVIWARRDAAPHPFTADDLHRYAVDRAAWLRGEVPE